MPLLLLLDIESVYSVSEKTYDSSLSVKEVISLSLVSIRLVYEIGIVTETSITEILLFFSRIIFLDDLRLLS